MQIRNDDEDFNKRYLAIDNLVVNTNVEVLKANAEYESSKDASVRLELLKQVTATGSQFSADQAFKIVNASVLKLSESDDKEVKMKSMDVTSSNDCNLASPKANVNFSSVRETTFKMVPRDANRVLIDGKYPNSKGGTPVKMGDEVVESIEYSCPEGPNHGHKPSEFQLDADQRAQAYMNMPKEVLVEHIRRLETENQTLNRDNHHLNGKTRALEDRANSIKVELQNVVGKLCEKIAAQNKYIKDLETNHELKYSKNKATHIENQRQLHELRQLRGIKKIQRSPTRRSGSHPPKAVDIYSPRNGCQNGGSAKKRKTSG